MNLKKTNIGMLLEDSFPFDIRVEKEATSLISAGYKVHLLCLSDKVLDIIIQSSQQLHPWQSRP